MSNSDTVDLLAQLLMTFFQVPGSSSSVRVQRSWVWRRLKESLANDKSRWDISKQDENPLSQQKGINVLQGGSHFRRCWLWEDQPGALHGGEKLLRCRGPRPQRGGPCQRGGQHPGQAFWPAGRLPLLPGADDPLCFFNSYYISFRRTTLPRAMFLILSTPSQPSSPRLLNLHLTIGT